MESKYPKRLTIFLAKDGILVENVSSLEPSTDLFPVGIEQLLEYLVTEPNLRIIWATTWFKTSPPYEARRSHQENAKREFQNWFDFYFWLYDGLYTESQFKHHYGKICELFELLYNKVEWYKYSIDKLELLQYINFNDKVLWVERGILKRNYNELSKYPNSEVFSVNVDHHEHDLFGLRVKIEELVSRL